MSAETQSPSPSDVMVQFICFTVGRSAYAVDIMAVREIRRWTETTQLPSVPDHVRGVINLRGIIVPIYDLRARFGYGATEPTRSHVIIIVAIGSRLVGLLVDAVLDILTIAPSQILPVPDLERGPESAFLSGVITINERMIALLGLDLLFDFDALPDFERGGM